MADAKKCDRCGKLYEVGNNAHLRQSRIKLFNGYWRSVGEYADLCDECYQSLMDWCGVVDEKESPGKFVDLLSEENLPGTLNRLWENVFGGL